MVSPCRCFQLAGHDKTFSAPVEMRRRSTVAGAGRVAVQDGFAPDGIDPAAQRVGSASLVLPEDAYFYDAAEDALKVADGVEHVSV